MSAKMALMLVEKFVFIAVLFQAIEMKKLVKEWSRGGIWDWSRLRLEYPTRQRQLLDLAMNDATLKRLLQVEIACAALGIFVPGFSFLALVLVAFLFAMNLLIAIRFRGSFNGGSDSMTLITIGILIVATVSARNHTLHQICLWLLTLQVARSFFASGFVKLKSKSWKDGTALAKLLTTSNYGPPEWLRTKLCRPSISRKIGWATLAFELAFPLGLLNSHLALLFVFAALIFHVANYFAFGLNRFFFAWLAVYPAYIYCSHA